MKKSILSLVIATSLASPVVSFADSDRNAILASFERDFLNGQTEVVVTAATKGDFDPWNYLVNVTRQYNEGSEAIQTSFERSFVKGQAEVVVTAATRGEFDPWNYVANVTRQYREDGDAIWTSFERSFVKGQAGTITTAAQAYDNAPWAALNQYEWKHLVGDANFSTKS